MTRYFAYLFLLAILGFASCTKLDSLSPFETSINPYLIQYSEGLHIAAQIKQKTNTKLQMNSDIIKGGKKNIIASSHIIKSKDDI